MIGVLWGGTGCGDGYRVMGNGKWVFGCGGGLWTVWD